MKRDALLTPVPVRFPRKTKRQLILTARRFGLNASAIIRQAVEQKLPEWEKSGVLIIEAAKGEPESEAQEA
jgi:predicted DNA-binding protein